VARSGEQSKVARFGVHSRFRLERGSDQAAPSLCASWWPWTADYALSLASEAAGHLSGSDRIPRYPTEGDLAASMPVGQGRLALSTVGKVRW